VEHDHIHLINNLQRDKSVALDHLQVSHYGLYDGRLHGREQYRIGDNACNDTRDTPGSGRPQRFGTYPSRFV
jgi:hypothetical protein